MAHDTNESGAPRDDWKAIHKGLGCYGCKYADETQLGIDRCCTYALTPDIDADGHCHSRKEVTP